MHSNFDQPSLLLQVFQNMFSAVWIAQVPKCHFCLQASPKCHYCLLASKKRQIKTFSPRHYHKTQIESVTKIFINQRESTHLQDNLKYNAGYAIFRVHFWGQKRQFFRYLRRFLCFVRPKCTEICHVQCFSSQIMVYYRHSVQGGRVIHVCWSVFTNLFTKVIVQDSLDFQEEGNSTSTSCVLQN